MGREIELDAALLSPEEKVAKMLPASERVPETKSKTL
jgi:hypothetical protein